MISRFLLLFSVLSVSVCVAQQYSTSPFSTQGIGEAGGLEDAQFGALGNCKAAAIDSNTVNTFNPASYAILSKGQPLFSVGVSSRFSTYTSGSASSKGNVAGLNQIIMVVPFAKRFGFALGLQPYSRKGYSIVQRDTLGTDSIQYSYLGSGSIQQVIGGLAYRFIDAERHKITLGVNYSYLFGEVTNERRSELVSNLNSGGVDQKTYKINSPQYSVGLNYTLSLNALGNQKLSFATVITPEQQLNAKRDYGLYYASTNEIGNPTVYDTLSFTTADKGKITQPLSAAFGFNYSFRPQGGVEYSLKNIYQINVYGDFVSTQWSKYSTNFSNEHESNVFANSSRFSFGIQFTPNFESISKQSGNSYLKRIRYRAGTYFGTLPNREGGTQLKEKAVTIGFGFPIAIQKTNSSFNISAQYGTRGTGQPDALKETFYSLNFGVILAPSSYDKWFKRYKLD